MEAKAGRVCRFSVEWVIVASLLDVKPSHSSLRVSDKTEVLAQARRYV